MLSASRYRMRQSIILRSYMFYYHTYYYVYDRVDPNKVMVLQ